MSGDLRARLEAAAAKSGRSIADEIRTRVEATLRRDQLDKQTRALLDGLELIPAEVERETGASWHRHTGAWETLRHAISSRLARLRPYGPERALGERPHRAIPFNDPGELGRWIEQTLWANPDFTNSELRRAMEHAIEHAVQRIPPIPDRKEKKK